MSADNIYPEYDKFLSRLDKETQLKQTGHVFWMYGLSGSGKSTIARALEKELHKQQHICLILDGDQLRSGLNSDLGFDDASRDENIRRTAEMAKILANQGLLVIVSVITPQRQFREAARNIIGDDFSEIYVKASFEACQQRDPKGLYQKVAKGQVANFTGKQSSFEEPLADPNTPNTGAQLILDTEKISPAIAVKKCLEYLSPYLNK